MVTLAIVVAVVAVIAGWPWLSALFADKILMFFAGLVVAGGAVVAAIK